MFFKFNFSSIFSQLFQQPNGSIKKSVQNAKTINPFYVLHEDPKGIFYFFIYFF